MFFEPKGEAAARERITRGYEAGMRLFYVDTDKTALVYRLFDAVLHRGAALGNNSPALAEAALARAFALGEKPDDGEQDIALFHVNSAGSDAEERKLTAFLTKKEQMLARAWATGSALPQDVGVLYGRGFSLPTGTAHAVMRIEVPPMDAADARRFLDCFDRYAALDDGRKQELCALLTGFDRDDAQRLLQLGMTEEDVFAGAAAWIRRTKTDRLKASGILELTETAPCGEDPRQELAERGRLPLGCANALDWLEEHRNAILTERGDDAVKGMLLLGVPGTGKSMFGKCCASILGLPMVRFDMGSILGGHVGDSEHNMDRVIDDLSFLAPAVLYIDEIEKAFSGADGARGDSGVMQRLFGKILGFMQDMDRTVFIIATANNISALPPELTRAGRFDVKFAMLMPDFAMCAALTASLLKKSGLPLTDDDRLCRYFTGAILQTLHCPDGGNAYRFFTGADLQTAVKEIRIQYREMFGDTPLAIAKETDMLDRLKACAKKASAYLSATAATDRKKTLDDLAAFYERILNDFIVVAHDGEHHLFDREPEPPEAFASDYDERLYRTVQNARERRRKNGARA